VARSAVLGREAEEFLAWLSAERGRSANTLSAYRRDLAGYAEFLAARGCTVTAADTRLVEDYLAFLRAAGRAPSSMARALAAVRGLHRFLAEEGEAAGDPSAAVTRPRVPTGLPKALSEPEVEALLAAVRGTDGRARRDRAVLEVLYGCGLRVSELVGLSLADLDLDTAQLRAFGKGSKERVVPIGRMARQALTEWLAPAGRDTLVPRRWANRGDAEALFLNFRGRRLSRQGAWDVVKRHAERAGLGGRLSPHVLRHSCATHMLDHGADIRVVQEMLGHASLSTTQVYTRVSGERLRHVYDLAHPRARLLRQGSR
jgi:integrase/recombinase XerD